MNLLELEKAMQSVKEGSDIYLLLEHIYNSQEKEFIRGFNEWANACNEYYNDWKTILTEEEEDAIVDNWPKALKPWYIQIYIEDGGYSILNSSGFSWDILKDIDEALKEIIESQLDDIDKNGVSFLKVNVAGLIKQDGSPIFTKDDYCVEKETKLAIEKLKLMLESDDASWNLEKDYIIWPCFQDIFL